MSLHVEHLSFSYSSNQVLSDISFDLEYGQIMSLLGPNGAGKSTLFRCILALNRPDEGFSSIDGLNTKQMSPREIAQKIAYIPQAHQPYFNYTVFEFVLMGTVSSGSMISTPGQLQKQRAYQALEELGILHLKDRGYMNLSGGERQLVLIARAIAQQAKILMMDEPCSNLDFGNQLKVMNMISYLKEKGYAILLSTHSPEHAYQYSDVIMALKDGKILALGSPQQMIDETVLSDLYQRQIKVYSLDNDAVRICAEKGDEE